MISLKSISKRYGDKRVLDNFSLTFPDTGVYAISAPSGAGKTTLLRLIAGLEKPDGGEITLPGNAKISMVFQEDRLLDALDVRGNITVVLQNVGDAGRLADECLDRCGLLEAAGKPVSSLSGGMKRRVAIARAIAFGGNILLLDEPFKGLDAATKQSVADFVFENAKDRLTIMVTHDFEESGRYADEIIKW